jgi:hypothetical protein
VEATEVTTNGVDAGAAGGEAAEAGSANGALGRPLPDGTTSVALALALAGFVLAAVGSTRRRSPLARGETLLYRAQPRRSPLNYLVSLGTWELSRRSTQFAVTQRRVIVERGVLRHHVRSIPLSSIGAVDLVDGLWTGVVRLSNRGGAAELAELGPLDARSARELASTLTNALAKS